MRLFTKALKTTILFFALLPALSYAQLNGTYVLSGRVNNDNGQPLVGTTVTIKGTTNATSTDKDGKFALTTNLKLPYTLVFTAIGFNPQEFLITNVNDQLKIQLTTQSLLINEVVVTAS